MERGRGNVHNQISAFLDQQLEDNQLVELNYVVNYRGNPGYEDIHPLLQSPETPTEKAKREQEQQATQALVHFLSTIHRTVISIRSLFGGLDESILPGLIDGEERVLGYYDEALTDCPPSETAMLSAQRSALNAKINEMKARSAVAA